MPRRPGSGEPAVALEYVLSPCPPPCPPCLALPGAMPLKPNANRCGIRPNPQCLGLYRRADPKMLWRRANPSYPRPGMKSTGSCALRLPSARRRTTPARGVGIGAPGGWKTVAGVRPTDPCAVPRQARRRFPCLRVVHAALAAPLAGGTAHGDATWPSTPSPHEHAPCPAARPVGPGLHWWLNVGCGHSRVAAPGPCARSGGASPRHHAHDHAHDTTLTTSR